MTNPYILIKRNERLQLELFFIFALLEDNFVGEASSCRCIGFRFEDVTCPTLATRLSFLFIRLMPAVSAKWRPKHAFQAVVFKVLFPTRR